jgi:hypothetical protein
MGLSSRSLWVGGWVEEWVDWKEVGSFYSLLRSRISVEEEVEEDLMMYTKCLPTRVQG